MTKLRWTASTVIPNGLWNNIVIGHPDVLDVCCSILIVSENDARRQIPQQSPLSNFVDLVMKIFTRILIPPPQLKFQSGICFGICLGLWLSLVSPKVILPTYSPSENTAILGHTIIGNVEASYSHSRFEGNLDIFSNRKCTS